MYWTETIASIVFINTKNTWTDLNMDKLYISTPEKGILSLQLNRPDCLNALDEELCTLLNTALAEAAIDPSVHCILLSGNGERAFSSGYDVKELANFKNDSFIVQNIRRYEWIWNIAAHPKPIVVANQGIAMGAGAIILVSADVRIGTSESIIRFTSAPHGTAMLTWNLPQLVGWSKAKEYLMTSKIITANEALSSGLLNAVTTKEDLLTEAMVFARMIAACEPTGPQEIKRLMREGQGKSQREQMNAEMNAMLDQQMTSGNRVGEWYRDMTKI